MSRRSFKEPAFADSDLLDADSGVRCHICPSDFHVKLYPRKDGSTSPTCWACIRAFGNPRKSRYSAA